MSEQKIFAVYRIYTKKERELTSTKSRFYGWSFSKNVVKAFLSQRTQGKYDYTKVYIDEEGYPEIDGYEIDDSNMINFVKLKSVSNGEYFDLFITANEMMEAEKRIQKYFRDLCAISMIDGKGDYMQMVLNIDEYYASALDFIGYRPPEISAMYTSADCRDDPGEIMGLDELIDDAYSGSCLYPSEESTNISRPLGLSTLTDIATKILYSLESFVKVLRDDL